MPVPSVLRRRDVQDVLVSIVFTVSVLAITVRLDAADEPGRSLDLLAFACILGVGLALAFRHRWPLVVLGAVLALTVTYVARDYTGGPFFLGIFVVIGTVASILETRRALPPVAAAVAVLAVVGFTMRSPDESAWVHLVYLSWSVVAFLGGKTVRDRRELLRGLRERNRHLEETREEEARRRVAEERVRIARDLHDIVAHNIAGISLQAATGVHVAEGNPGQARQALVAIRDASRQTLDELRSTLHLLREGEDSLPLAPTPGPSALPDLVASVEAAGLPVTLDRLGDLDAVPDAVAGAAYRIVQESLTNVMRHAGPARATVTVTEVDGGLRVVVEDDGRGVADPAPSRPQGHGLAGMAERAAALGGTFDAGSPGEGGGFVVRAWLPGATDGDADRRAPHPAAAREGGT